MSEKKETKIIIPAGTALVTVKVTEQEHQCKFCYFENRAKCWPCQEKYEGRVIYKLVRYE